MEYRDKLDNIGFQNLTYLFIILSNMILLSGDIEVNSGPNSNIDVKNKNFSQKETNMSTYRLEPSTLSGIYKQNVHNRDERFMGPFFQWTGNDSSFDESLWSSI